MQAVLVCLGLFAVAAVVLWAMLAFVGGRTARALEETARTLGLERTAPEPGGHEAARDVVYAGTVDGVAVRVGAGRRVTTTVQPTIVSVVGVGAALPQPLSFALTIGRAGTPLARTLRLGDRRFDRRCAVSTSDEAAARAALASPEAREAVRELLGSGGSSGVITGSEVYVGVFDAHLRGARALVDAVRRVVRVARALSPD
jgi:hypothetical protein